METINDTQYEEFEADATEFVVKHRDDIHIANFVENCSLGYDKEGAVGVRYSPYKPDHANTCISAEQRDFFVYYAFPNGSRTPVGSFWAQTRDGKFKFIHIDLGKVMELVIRYYQNRGCVPPPKRESKKQDNG